MVPARDTLVIASFNKGKIREIAELLQGHVQTVVGIGDYTQEEPEETGTTFAANARIKAENAVRITGLPSLADDSGLAVTALDGAPGIYSARWAGPDKDFTAAMAQVNTELGDTPDRSARFVCALCLAHPDGSCLAVEGTVEGNLIWPPRGNKGFGYDPMFVPEGYTTTFAEMDATAKASISHRTRAFEALLGVLDDQTI